MACGVQLRDDLLLVVRFGGCGWEGASANPYHRDVTAISTTVYRYSGLFSTLPLAIPPLFVLGYGLEFKWRYNHSSLSGGLQGVTYTPMQNRDYRGGKYNAHRPLNLPGNSLA